MRGIFWSQLKRNIQIFRTQTFGFLPEILLWKKWAAPRFPLPPDERMEPMPLVALQTADFQTETRDHSMFEIFFTDKDLTTRKSSHLLAEAMPWAGVIPIDRVSGVPGLELLQRFLTNISENCWIINGVSRSGTAMPWAGVIPIDRVSGVPGLEKP